MQFLIVNNNAGKQVKWKMKHSEYDSPFELTVSDIAAQAARNIDEMSWNTVQRVGINVNKEKLLIALKQDAERYREAYEKGYETGYEKRYDDIVRCKDCIHYRYYGLNEYTVSECTIDHCENPDANWFCADGERRESE